MANAVQLADTTGASITTDNPLPVAVTGAGDATAANQAAANTKLDTLITYVDGLEALIAATNTKLDTLIADSTAAAVYSPPRVVTWTPSVDTTALAAGDVIADTEAVSGFFRANDVGTTLIGLTVLDKTDNTAANLDMTFVFFKSNVSLGTENSAPSITDTNAEHIIGLVRVQSTDVIDLGLSKVAYVQPKPVPLTPLSGTDDVAVAIFSANSGAPDFDASALVVNFIVMD